MQLVLNVLCARTHTHKIATPSTALIRAPSSFSHFQPLVFLSSIVDTKASGMPPDHMTSCPNQQSLVTVSANQRKIEVESSTQNTGSHTHFECPIVCHTPPYTTHTFHSFFSLISPMISCCEQKQLSG